MFEKIPVFLVLPLLSEVLLFPLQWEKHDAIMQ